MATLPAELTSFVGRRADLGLNNPFEVIQEAQRAVIEAARQALGDRGFTVADERGRSMSYESLVAYALERDREPGASTRSSVLTAREAEVAALLADGLTNAEIAKRLFISARTVRGHIENTMTTLGLGNGAQIAAWVVREEDT